MCCKIYIYKQNGGFGYLLRITPRVILERKFTFGQNMLTDLKDMLEHNNVR